MIDWESYGRNWRPEYGKLYLVISNGLPMKVCSWETGSGFVDLSSGRSLPFDIRYVAKVNLPKDSGDEE